MSIYHSTKKKTTEHFIQESHIKHNNLYDYSKTCYKTSQDKVIIICKIHGEFLQRASHHLGGHGCNKCGTNKSHISKTKDSKLFIIESNQIHNEKYDYAEVEYKNNHTKVNIICNIKYLLIVILEML